MRKKTSRNIFWPSNQARQRKDDRKMKMQKEEKGLHTEGALLDTLRTRQVSRE